ncbi:TMV resistance protein N-like, partial [Trifolium medium]|nr:TMV resistance protein N-like [Trifolium medium]
MGDQISPFTFFKAMQVSRILIVVLSKHFAASTYCLEELTKILECRKTKNQHIIPIFYGVDPTEVRLQIGGYGKYIAAHQRRFADSAHHRWFADSEMLQKWKSALSEVANISGWVFGQG